MTQFTIEGLTAAAATSFAKAPDPRLAEVTAALVRHLHAFVLETRPTHAEWLAGIEYLTKVGHKCQGARQEFILLSDVLGVSMLVDALNESPVEDATRATLLGPFYVDNPKPLAQGGDLAAGAAGCEDGVPLWIDVVVQDTAGRPLAGAEVDIWQCAPDALYDVQRDLAEGEQELRGRLHADGDGRVRCWSVLPVPYCVPDDGPVGELLGRAQRHAWRPAHIHFRIAAPGHQTLVTHLFPADSPWLDQDTVFGVKPELVVEMPAGEGPMPPGHAPAAGWRRLDFTFSLVPA